MDCLIKGFDIAYSVLVISFFWMVLLYISWKVVYSIYKKDIRNNSFNIFEDDRDKH